MIFNNIEDTTRFLACIICIIPFKFFRNWFLQQVDFTIKNVVPFINLLFSLFYICLKSSLVFECRSFLFYRFPRLSSDLMQNENFMEDFISMFKKIMSSPLRNSTNINIRRCCFLVSLFRWKKLVCCWNSLLSIFFRFYILQCCFNRFHTCKKSQMLTQTVFWIKVSFWLKLKNSPAYNIQLFFRSWSVLNRFLRLSNNFLLCIVLVFLTV